jgi:thioredoxin-like negative regulator of GroEL
VNIAQTFATLGRYEDALPYLEAGIGPHNTGSRLGVHLAAAYAKAGRDDEAYNLWYEHRAKFDFANAAAAIYFNASPALRERMTRQAIADRPGSVHAHVALANIQHKGGDTDAALATIQEAYNGLTIAPRTALVLEAAQFVLHHGLERRAAEAASTTASPAC